MNQTINDIYSAINPLPEMLSAKGKVSPGVTCMIDANAEITIYMNWKKDGGKDWETECECCRASDFEEALAQAAAYISALPTAEVAKLHSFMGQLGRLIDAGRNAGINVDYMNPLLDTMKRLSENVITYRPQP